MKNDFLKKSKNYRAQKSRGFTLIETLVSLAIFILLITVVNSTASAIIREVHAFRANTALSGLADQYVEIARNLPYSQVGTLSGNPHGSLPDMPNPTTAIVNGISYQIYYVVNYIDDPADGTIVNGTDFAPNDYKQIKLYIKNTATGVTTSFLSNISPKGLESLNGGGALAIKVFDAVGQPVPNASINITNSLLVPNINLTRLSDGSGNWNEVGLSASANSYHITVTKNGYSTDATYPITAGNPNPVKPNATILDGQVTQVSFAIDRLSALVFNTFNQTCDGVPNIGVEVHGAKLIGTPNVLKFNTDYTSNSSGQISLPNTEWDNYTPALTTSDTYMIYGSSPIQQISVMPNTNQTYTLVIGPKTNRSLLVIVKDSASGNPIKDATVTLKYVGDADIVKLTSGSIWSQNDWSGGAGQINFTDPSKYFSDSNTLDGNGIPSGLRLANYGNGTYASSGLLESSTFDTGTSASFYTSLVWQPQSQDPATSVKFQIATNNDNATWQFVGPDGTVNTYFSVPGTTIHSGNSDKRYIRYKTILETSDASKTPVLTSVGVNYVSGCFTPGQAMFPGLNHSNYDVTASTTGYQTYTNDNLAISGYNTLEVLLTP